MKKDSVMRQILIIKHLTNRKMTFEELLTVLEYDSEIYGGNYVISLRTFQRDKKDISTLYGIEIIFDKHNKTYHIPDRTSDSQTERIIDAFNVFNALNATDNISAYVIFENRKASGSHFIMDIVAAIKNRKLIKITHQSYNADVPFDWKVEPLAVKEFRYRWYLVAKDKKDGIIKTFGLDRISGIVQLPDKYEYPSDFDIENYAKDQYGVVFSDEEPVYIELLFTPFQGKYMKTLPMHPSQKIIKDDEAGLLVSLHLIPTGYDFMRDLLQFGDSVKVIKPKGLADRIKQMHLEAAGRY